MCKWNEVLDTVNCTKNDESYSTSPYKQGRILSNVFTFNQDSIITSSTLVDLTCRNTWCVTDWRKRPNTCEMKIHAATFVLNRVSKENFQTENHLNVSSIPTDSLSHSLDNSLSHSLDDSLSHNSEFGQPANRSCLYNNLHFNGSIQHLLRSQRNNRQSGDYDDHGESSEFLACRFEARNQIGSNYNTDDIRNLYTDTSAQTARKYQYTSAFSVQPKCIPVNHGYLQNRHPNAVPKFNMHAEKLMDNQLTQEYHNGFSNAKPCCKGRESCVGRSRGIFVSPERPYLPVSQLLENNTLRLHGNWSSSSKKLEPLNKKSSEKSEQSGELHTEKTTAPSTEQPFQCSYCQYKCSSKCQLTGHIRSHTGEKPYECKVTSCGKTFARNEELTRHLRIHSGYCPYLCCQCNKRFSRKDHLNKHARTHLKSYEKRIYVCEVPDCGQRYTRSDALARHQWTSHGFRPRQFQSV